MNEIVEIDGTNFPHGEPMGRGNLFFMMGVQRSGKSTFATEWLRAVILNGRPRSLICSDDIRLALYGERYRRQGEPMVWAMNGYMTETLLSRGHDVLIDGTNTTRDSIKRILDVDINATPFVVITPKEVCLRRAVTTNQSDLLPVIERCHTQLEELRSYGIEKTIQEIRKSILKRRNK
jgi:predicted kinase